MTCRLSVTDWRDVLYNAVRQAPGGVKAAAAFLADRRGRSIHPEQLRTRLRGVDGDSLSMDMVELLTEWLQELRRDDALAWLHALNSAFGLVAAEIPDAPPGGWPDEIVALQNKLLEAGVHGGKLNEIGLRITADKRIEQAEADEMEAAVDAEIQLLNRMKRNVRRAAQGGAA